MIGGWATKDGVNVSLAEGKGSVRDTGTTVSVTQYHKLVV